MAAAIPEVAETASAAAARRKANRMAARRRGRVPVGERIGARAQTSTRQAAVDAPFEYGRQARNVGSNARLTPGDRSYQPVILAEFLAAVVILIAVPVVKGGSPAAQAKGSPSPYDTGDLRQLVAVGLVYFVLALISSGNSGRLAAWFGGLILIVLALGKVAHGDLTATVKNLTPPADTGTDPGTTT